MTGGGLRFGPLGPGTIHVCIDMQRLFGDPTAWHTPALHHIVANVVSVCEVAGARTLLLSGVETDVCVLATALDAVDHGYRGVLIEDAITSSSPEAHAATLTHVIPRYDRQIECIGTQSLTETWKP